RTRRCVGGMAPPVRREGAALTVAAFAKNAGHGFTISIAATGRCTSGGEGGNLPLPQGRHRVILRSLLAGAATRFVRRHSTWRVMTTPSSNSFLADVGASDAHGNRGEPRRVSTPWRAADARAVPRPNRRAARSAARGAPATSGTPAGRRRHDLLPLCGHGAWAALFEDGVEVSPEAQGIEPPHA